MHPFCPKTWTPIGTTAQLHGANTHNTHTPATHPCMACLFQQTPPKHDMSLPELPQLSSSSLPQPPLRPPDMTRPRATSACPSPANAARLPSPPLRLHPRREPSTRWPSSSSPATHAVVSGSGDTRRASSPQATCGHGQHHTHCSHHLRPQRHTPSSMYAGDTRRARTQTG